jgi:hypothetical protein
MANPVIPNLDGSNPGPAGVSTVNTVSAYGDAQFQQVISVTMTPVSVAAASAVEQSFGLNGVTFVTATTSLKPGDVITGVTPPSDVAGVGPMYGRVDPTTVDKFYVKFVNPTAGALVPASGVYNITIWRPTLGYLATPQTAVLG